MKKLPVLLSLLMIFTFLLSACAPAATPPPAATRTTRCGNRAPLTVATEPPAEPTAAANRCTGLP